MAGKYAKAALVSLAVSTMIFGGCASRPATMQAEYVSPTKYQKFDCDQLSMETDELARRTEVLYAELDKKAARDEVQMGIGLFLLWPTLFLLEGGDGADATEFKRIKGELEAVRTMSTQKKCGIDFSDKTPESIMKRYEEDKKRQMEEERKRQEKEREEL